MKYSTNNIDMAVRRKLHIRMSFLNQKFKNFSSLPMKRQYGLVISF